MVAWSTVPSYVKSKVRTDQLLNRSIRGHSGRSQIYTTSPQLFTHFFEAGASSLPFVNTQTHTGTGTSTVALTGSTTVAGGAFVVVNGTATDEYEFAGPLTFKPSSAASAPMFAECRMKNVGTTTATDGTFWFGWSDATNYAGVLSTLGATGTLTSTGPTVAAMIGYSSLVTVTGATGYVSYVAADYKAATGTLRALSGSGGVVTKDSAYHVFRVEVDANGAVSYLVDNKLKFRTGTGAIVTGTALAPYFYWKSEGGHILTSTIDYLVVGTEQVA